MTTPPSAPRVFVSYSHDSPDHEQRVLDLAQALRRDGIDAWIDQFEPAPRQGWPRWMQQQIHRADFILIVCTATYRERFEGQVAPEGGAGRGATWEGMLANQLQYEGRFDHRTLVPVLFEGSEESDVPTAVRAGTYHRLPQDYAQLVRRLTDQLAVTPAALGPVDPAPHGGMPEMPGPGEVPSPDTMGDAMAEMSSEVVDPATAIRARLEAEVAGRFQIEALVAKGTLAYVFRALDLELQRPVSLKVVDPRSLSPEIALKLKETSKAVAMLKHRGILIVHARHSSGELVYTVNEYVDKVNFHALLHTLGPQAIGRSLTIIERIADALDYAHHRGCIHGELRPSHVMMDPYGWPVLSPFKLSVRTQYIPKDSFTAEDVLYSSPEQLDGVAPTERSDQYSLGLLAHELVLGRPLFAAKTLSAALREKEQFDAATRDLSLPAPLPSLLSRMVARDPAERYTNLDEVRRIVVAELGALRHRLDPRSQLAFDSFRRLRGDMSFYATFYDRLLDALPHMRPMFRNLPSQHRALGEAIDNLLWFPVEPAAQRDDGCLARVAATHHRRGVTRAYYELFAEILVQTVGDKDYLAAGDDGAIVAAWKHAISEGVAFLIERAAQ